MKAINASVAVEERKNSSGEGIRKGKLVRDATIINLAEIATSTLVSSANISKDGRAVL